MSTTTVTQNLTDCQTIYCPVCGHECRADWQEFPRKAFWIFTCENDYCGTPWRTSTIDQIADAVDLAKWHVSQLFDIFTGRAK